MAIPKAKICGIRRLEDAQVAADAGADYIGLVFVPGRPRRVDIPTAAAIVSGIKAAGVGAPKVVGLFADQPLEEVNRTADACGLDLLQLCGGESTEYCAGAVRPVIKVVHIPGSIRRTDFAGRWNRRRWNRRRNGLANPGGPDQELLTGRTHGHAGPVGGGYTRRHRGEL